MARILIVESDQHISATLCLNLKSHDHDTEAASTISEAWKLLKTQHFDLMCLDVAFPDGNGLDFCQKIRNEGYDIPVLFLSARTDEATIVKAIHSGADDYIRKPFGIEELKFRMNKILRKFTIPSTTITFEKLTIDPLRRVVTIMDEVVTLGKKELEILVLLTKKAGEIVSRETILATLYENADLYDRTVDSHMSHLRKKIREAAGANLQINSVYGLGYRLEWKNK